MMPWLECAIVTLPVRSCAMSQAAYAPAHWRFQDVSLRLSASRLGSSLDVRRAMRGRRVRQVHLPHRHHGRKPDRDSEGQDEGEKSQTQSHCNSPGENQTNAATADY